MLLPNIIPHDFRAPPARRTLAKRTLACLDSAAVLTLGYRPAWGFS